MNAQLVSRWKEFCGVDGTGQTWAVTLLPPFAYPFKTFSGVNYDTKGAGVRGFLVISSLVLTMAHANCCLIKSTADDTPYSPSKVTPEFYRTIGLRTGTLLGGLSTWLL